MWECREEMGSVHFALRDVAEMFGGQQNLSLYSSVNDASTFLVTLYQLLG